MEVQMDNLTQQIKTALDEYAFHSARGRRAAERTKQLYFGSVCAAFRQLAEMGYKLQKPENLKEKHVQALVQHWWEEQKLTPKSLENNLSRLRRFCTIVGHPRLVKKAEHYLPDTPKDALAVRKPTKEPPAVSDAEMEALFIRADEKDWRFGLMLRMQFALGLAVEEALKCNPHSQYRSNTFYVGPGEGIGKRTRMIRLTNPKQHEMLDLVKSKIPAGERLGWFINKNGSRATLKQNLARYRHLARVVGLTKESGITTRSLRQMFHASFGVKDLPQDEA
jgi:site-specific recombinase XerC